MGRVVDQTGLNERLRQHARQSGMMIGVSMALAIALSLGAFVWIFFRLDPYLTDFTGGEGGPRAALASPVAALVASPAAGGPTATRPGRARAAASPATAASPVAVGPPPTPTALAAAASPTATPPFVATHIVADFGEQVNLRAGPSSSSGRLALVAPGTKLRYLGESQQVGDVLWMKFQTERGDIGWIRDLDVRPVTRP
ncbi:MAG TPA: SH3 domain-containing protein [Thermomicrobiales bacterium]|nr:SH3 domain-containing protein [Thermomicrobiales bacterium]